MNNGYLTIAQFRELYPMGSSTLYRLVARGELRITKIGSASRIAVDEAKRWAASLPTFGGRVH
jgi:excisionase family DNA binding protein